MKPSWCPHPNAGLIWDMTAVITLDLDDDASLHDLAMIHHLLAMRVTKQKNNPSTEPSDGSPSSDWLRQGTCLAHNSRMDGHVFNSEHCLITLSEQHRQLAQLYGRLSMSDKSGMELIADCSPRSNGSKLDHCLGILQHDDLDRITGTPRACS